MWDTTPIVLHFAAMTRSESNPTSKNHVLGASLHLPKLTHCQRFKFEQLTKNRNRLPRKDGLPSPPFALS